MLGIYIKQSRMRKAITGQILNKHKKQMNKQTITTRRLMLVVMWCSKLTGVIESGGKILVRSYGQTLGRALQIWVESGGLFMCEFRGRSQGK